MAYPDNLLVQGERVIVNKRPHWKVLILPTILFIVIIGGGVGAGHLDQQSQLANDPQSAYYAIIGVALVALIVLVLVPFIRWRTEHFVITNHHVFFRTGLLSRREHQIPLGQIANMETEVTFWGRLMGYGSLIVESSADQPLKFRNVASLSKVQAAAEPADPRRTGADPSRARPRAGSWVGNAGSFPQQGYQQPQGYHASSTWRRNRATRSRATRRGAAGLSAAGLPAGGSGAAGVSAHPGLPAAARLPAAGLPSRPGYADRLVHPARRHPSRRRPPGSSEVRPTNRRPSPASRRPLSRLQSHASRNRHVRPRGRRDRQPDPGFDRCDAGTSPRDPGDPRGARRARP